MHATEMRQAEHLRRQADRCRRLTLSIGDRGVIETLGVMACEYDARAAALEAASRSR
jgi:hypothetical protein